ncbi:MAG: RsmB/NOP family class I SAM-dependent RNA methyltransferase [Candidatus ainarchaeum sp.]|nr:RsmB/NOP family class I SAM-dependent RNA methyltransferase [Candidatus ainarchaeum sp.]
MKTTYFPDKFIEKYKYFCKNEWGEFFTTIQIKQPKSFWVNSNLTNKKEVEKNLNDLNIKFQNYPFHNFAYGIDYPNPGQLELFKSAKISIQEKASMLPVIALNPTNQDYVLDACASPGTKTIQLSNFSKKVKATDVNSKRIEILNYNKKKYNLKNVEVVRADVRNVKDTFDKILLDAPCSSEGLVRKDFDALKEWTPKLVLEKARLQKEILIYCFDLLKYGGQMVYSTCSFAPEENEDVVNFLMQKREDATVEKINLDGIKIRYNPLCENYVRLWPQDNNTQQFGFCLISKKD